MGYIRRSIGVAGLIALMGCGLDDPGSQPRVEVSEDVILDLAQTLHPNGSELAITFRSRDLFQCDGVGYDYSLDKNIGSVQIHLHGVSVPEVCHGGQGHAFETVRMPSEEGEYVFGLNIGNQIQNQGLLRLDDIGYSLQLNSSHGVKVEHYSMYRIPAGTIWGYFATDDDGKEVQQILAQHLENEVSDTPLTQGFYGHFRLDGNGHFQMLPSPVEAHAHTFLYQFDGNASSLALLVSKVRSYLPPGTVFKVYSWDGNVL